MLILIIDELWKEQNIKKIFSIYTKRLLQISMHDVFIDLMGHRIF